MNAYRFFGYAVVRLWDHNIKGIKSWITMWLHVMLHIYIICFDFIYINSFFIWINSAMSHVWDYIPFVISDYITLLTNIAGLVGFCIYIYLFFDVQNTGNSTQSIEQLNSNNFIWLWKIWIFRLHVCKTCFFVFWCSDILKV